MILRHGEAHRLWGHTASACGKHFAQPFSVAMPRLPTAINWARRGLIMLS
jgi:hypothetical protein